MKIKYVLTSDIEMPKYANVGDACMDIRAAEDCFIKPGDTAMVGTGIKVIIPEGYELQIRARSGLSLNTPLRIANGIGTIDAGFRHEMKVLIHNSSNMFNDFFREENGKTYYDFSPTKTEVPIFDITEKGNKSGIYHIKKGDRIAQIAVYKIENFEFESYQGENFDMEGNNRGGGFGHSGLK